MAIDKGIFGIRLTSVLIVATTLALMATGFAAINVSQQAEGTSGLVVRQMIYGCGGLVGFVFMMLIPYQKIGKYAYPLFGFMLGLLVLVLFLPANRGCQRWIGLGPIQVQPSEFAKLALIILLAWYLRIGDHYRKALGLIPPFVLTLIPMGLILREPDLGTSLLLLPTLYAMLFMAGAKIRHLLGIVLVGVIVLLFPVPRPLGNLSPLEVRQRVSTAYWVTGPAEKPDTAYSAAALAAMKFHQLTRINGWLRQGSEDVIQDEGYQLFQSKIVLGSGMFTGKGNWQHGEIYFRNLPEDHTDFIFSIIAGQWGFIGCVGGVPAVWRDNCLRRGDRRDDYRSVRQAADNRRYGPYGLADFHQRGHDHGTHADHRHDPAAGKLRRFVARGQLRRAGTACKRRPAKTDHAQPTPVRT